MLKSGKGATTRAPVGANKRLKPAVLPEVDDYDCYMYLDFQVHC